MITGYNWELYNVKDDPTESDDLAAKMPAKLKEMQDLFYAEAKKNQVLPLDNSTLARWNTPRPSLTAGRKVFTYSGELTGVPASGAPDILNKAYTITAEVEIPDGGAEGMIVTQGGRFGGYGLFLSKGEFGFGRGKVVFLYNLLDLKRTVWEGPELEAGKHTVKFDFKPEGPGLGKGGTGVLYVDGQEVARNSMDHTTPITFPEDETFDIGQDTRTPLALVEYRYDVPFKFTGKIDKLTFELDPGSPRRNRDGSGRLIRDGEAPGSNIDEKVLILAAVAEAMTGLALLLVPSLVGRLLFGEPTHRRRHTGRTCCGHCADCAERRLLAGAAGGRHADLQRGRHYISRLCRFRGRLGRHLLWPAVALHLVLTATLARATIRHSAMKDPLATRTTLFPSVPGNDRFGRNQRCKADATS